MKIALTTIYGEVYSQDKLFDSASCSIGENLLLPGIRLKQHLEGLGHQLHTLDMYQEEAPDYVIFLDISPAWYFCLQTPADVIKYVLKRKWRKDAFRIASQYTEKKHRLLIIQEPPVVNPLSYDVKYHDRFGKIMTWDDDLVDGEKYVKFFYPQVMPDKKYNVLFSEKKFLTMMCSNKTSNGENELYSERRKAIEYCESQDLDFDLYGYGWGNLGLKKYRGTAEKKLDTLSQYKFSLCYENMCGVKGYITEKIFDCFFAGCVPVYLGADNVTDYIPSGAFIDRRMFSDLAELTDYMMNMSEKEYQNYFDQAQDYLRSDRFQEFFSIDAYINRMYKAIFE